MEIFWHTHTTASSAQVLQTDPIHGLSQTEANERLQRCGENRLRKPRKAVFWRVLIEELLEPMMLLLLGTAVLYSLWGELGDAIAIIVIVVTVIFIEVFTEYRAKASVAALTRLSTATTPIIRDSRFVTAPSEVLVPGDVVFLRSGERLTADVRLIETIGLQMDESALTGESMPVSKDAEIVLPRETPLSDQSNVAFAGTTVSAGYGRGLVFATGMATQLGQITGQVIEAKQPYTPLQVAMYKLSNWLSLIALGFSTLIPLLGWFYGQPWREMILMGLMLAFATIPEELPIIITLLLGLSAFRLSRRHAILRRLRAVEMLGLVSIIATDKTGTLTQNKMTVTHVCTDEPKSIPETLSTDEMNLLKEAAICHDASIMEDRGHIQFAGDPIEIAILECADRYSLLSNQSQGLAGKTLSLQSFDSERKLMSVIYHPNGGKPIQIVKGAPESIIARAIRHQCGDLNVHHVQSQVDQMAADGLRVIAFASHELSDVETVNENDLTLLGLIGVSDPVRPEVPDAVAALRKAGIRVLMITGDHPVTARVIAHQVGLDGDILTGQQLNDMDDHVLSTLLTQTSICARLTPRDKLRIVSLLRRQGFVAATGDGVNDAPALAEANVGIAMGEIGTDVAREVADLTLSDDNFATIAKAIEEGRTVQANLRKGVSFYLACKLALVSTATLATILQFPVPYVPIQLAVMEAFMDLVGSSTFTVEPAEYDVMSRPPRDPTLPFMDLPLISHIAVCGFLLFAGVFTVFLLMIAMTDDYMSARTAAFLSWMTGYLVLAWVMRSENTPIYIIGFRSNKLLPFWTLLTICTVAAVMSSFTLRNLLKLGELSPAQWAIAIIVPSLPLFYLEIIKVIRYSKRSAADSEC